MLQKKTISLILFAIVCSSQFSQSSTYKWTQIANLPALARHRCSAFTIGSMGYLGLGHANSQNWVVYDDFWQYNPATNSWTQIANYGGGIRYNAAAFVIDGIAYVGTGRDNVPQNHTDFWKYDPIANQWLAIASFPGSPRRGCASFVLNGLGYVGTGSNNSDFYAYNPSNNTWISRAPYPQPKQAAMGFAIGDRGYVGTGSAFGSPTNNFFEYNPNTNQWTPKAPVGPLIRTEACAFAMNGKGYIGAGEDDDTFWPDVRNYRDFWEYDPGTNTWIEVLEFPGTTRRYMAAFVIGNSAYCGTGTNGTNFSDFWKFQVGGAIGEDDLVANNIKVSAYPNPMRERITITWSAQEGDNSRSTFVELFDINGRKVRTVRCIREGHIVLHRGNLPAGQYLYQLLQADALVARGQIVIQ